MPEDELGIRRRQPLGDRDPCFHCGQRFFAELLRDLVVEDTDSPQIAVEAPEALVLTLEPDALGIDVTPRLATLKVVEPPRRKGGGKVADAKELVSKLRNEAKVI